MPQDLNVKNFALKGNTLLLNGWQKEITLVFFRSEECSGCVRFRDIFIGLERNFQNVMGFATLDIGRNRNVLMMAQKSKTPIPHVPYLLLYLRGSPFAIYKGSLGSTALTSFVHKVLSELGKENFTTTTNFAPPPPAAPSRPGGPSHAGPRSAGGYAVMGGGGAEDEEDPSVLLCPTNVIPHNQPWAAEYRKIELELSNGDQNY